MHPPGCTARAWAANCSQHLCSRGGRGLCAKRGRAWEVPAVPRVWLGTKETLLGKTPAICAMTKGQSRADRPCPSEHINNPLHGKHEWIHYRINYYAAAFHLRLFPCSLCSFYRLRANTEVASTTRSFTRLSYSDWTCPYPSVPIPAGHRASCSVIALKIPDL